MSKQKLTDQEIVRAIKSGNDHQALKQLYKDNYSRIERFVMNRGGRRSDAKDIFQETVIIFYVNALKPDFKLTSTLSTFLHGIAKNRLRKELGKKGKTLSLNEDILNLLVDIPDESFLEVDKKEQVIIETLEEIGPRCKSILYEYYFYKKSMKEIAKAMDYTNAANARNQKYRCKEELKKLVLKKFNH